MTTRSSNRTGEEEIKHNLRVIHTLLYSSRFCLQLLGANLPSDQKASRNITFVSMIQALAL
jgi:hypothetical protein